MASGKEQWSAEAIPPSQPTLPDSHHPQLIPYRSGLEDRRRRASGFAIVRSIIYCIFFGGFAIISLVMGIVLIREEWATGYFNVTGAVFGMLFPVCLMGYFFVQAAMSLRKMLRGEKRYPFEP